MRRPTILLVSYHYLPAATPGSHRLNTVARLLTQRGWDCTILTATGAEAGGNHDDGIEVVRTTRRHLRSNHGRAAIDRPFLSRVPGVRREAPLVAIGGEPHERVEVVSLVEMEQHVAVVQVLHLDGRQARDRLLLDDRRGRHREWRQRRQHQEPAPHAPLTPRP